MRSQKKKSKQVLLPDFCVIGAGSGGLSFAAGAVQMGASVVLVEASKMGGDCLNTGCVPSKSLISAAKSYHDIGKGGAFCASKPSGKLEYKKIHKHIHDVIKSIAPNDSVERFEKLGVTVLKGKGEFIDADSLIVGNDIIQAKRFIIATGSSPFIPPINGLEKVPFYTNETIFEMNTLPKTMIVIGGGPIGIEMAQSYSRLGTKVTVLEAFTILPKDDADMVAKLKDVLHEEGVTIHEKVKILNPNIA